jgi:oligopeptide/dipeptide ABC transporter ATP-binding protein
MADSVLDVRSVSVAFGDRRRSRSATHGPSREVLAVDDVTIEVGEREIIGIVGESGSGKSTLCKVMAGLHPVTAGTIRYQGRELAQARTVDDRRAIQMVFQDPYTSLNPRLRIGSVLDEALRVGGVPKDTRARAASELVSSVGLSDSVLTVRPSRLSGGQRQRVAIARALAVRPRVLLADEVTSALDVSIQATIVDLLAALTIERDLSLVFVTHNLQVVRALCQRVVVLHAGRVVEAGSISDIFTSPQHPYTRSLLAAIPRLHGNRPLADGSTDRVAPAVGGRARMMDECHFRTLCPLARQTCAEARPPLAIGRGGHSVACYAVGGQSQEVGWAEEALLSRTEIDPE